MRLSDAGRNLLKDLEGLRLEAYPDGKNPDGSPRYSIGYGHNGATKGQRINQSEADRLFDADVARFEKAVTGLVDPAETTQGQFDVLVSFAYNVGEGPKGLAGSTLLKLHNDGHYSEAAGEFERWIHSGGVVDARLVDRRAREALLYAAATPGAAAPEVPGETLRPNLALAGVGLIFFCPSCGGRCVASLAVDRAGVL